MDSYLSVVQMSKNYAAYYFLVIFTSDYLEISLKKKGSNIIIEKIK